MTRTAALIAGPVAAVVLFVGGCSSGGSTDTASSSTAAAESNPLGDIPDDQVFVPYSPADDAFSVQVPEGWARSDLSDGVSFTDKLNTVAVQEMTGRPEPTPDTVLAGELADIAASGRAVKIGTAESVTLPSGPTVHGTYSEDSAPDPVTKRVVRDDVELYVFWRAGTEVLLTLSGPHGADNVDPWAQISRSFAWQ
jgi:hypothetical protein